MEDFTGLIGRNGVIIVIGILFFLITFKYSVNLFKWIEDQTYGTRDYIMSKFELMFMEVNPIHVTYALVISSFGAGLFVAAIFSLFGKFLAGFIMGSIFAFIGWKLPRPVIDFMVDRRVKQYQNQMVDGLNLLSNGLRAGLSVPQAIGMVVSELPAPINQEFNMILQQNKIGVPLEECFENLYKRVPTEDNQMFVTGVNILRETGGNLAETFDTISSIIRERIRLQQKVDTYTAQGMFQGYTMAAMPIIIGLIFSASDPKTMLPLFNTIMGNVLLLVAVGFDLTGLYIILKIVKIKT